MNTPALDAQWCNWIVDAFSLILSEGFCIVLQSLQGFIDVEDDFCKAKRSQSEPPLLKGQILDEEDLANELGNQRYVEPWISSWFGWFCDCVWMRWNVRTFVFFVFYLLVIDRATSWYSRHTSTAERPFTTFGWRSPISFFDIFLLFGSLCWCLSAQESLSQKLQMPNEEGLVVKPSVSAAWTSLHQSDVFCFLHVF